MEVEKVTVEIVEQRLKDIAKELNVDVMEDIVLGTYFDRYAPIPHEMGKETISLYAKPENRGKGYHPADPNKTRIN